MKEFACCSSTMRELFRIALQVLLEFLDHKSNRKLITLISKTSQSNHISDRKVITRKSASDAQNSSQNKASKIKTFSVAQKKQAEYLYKKTMKVLNW